MKKPGKEKKNKEATEGEVELSAIQDLSDETLSEEELNYYLNLEDFPVD